MDQENRVVVLIDMDCFYCQVEEKLNPELKGKPIAVVQYNPWKGGGIIAVNYVARAKGVTRHMRGDEAKDKCPEIELPSVPCQRGKADISKYREAGKEVAKVLQKFTALLERASIDEAYLDITAGVQDRFNSLNANRICPEMLPNTYALGYECLEEFIGDVHSCTSSNMEFDYEHAKQLLVGAVIVSEIRAAVYDETGYRCSAGIAHNKILAKLVCGMNKPNKQTVLPKHSINMLYKTLPVKKVKHLGGKFGDTVCEILRIKNMNELQTFSEKELQARFDDKNGTWLYKIARGIDLEPVQARFNPKSIGCCKQFKGKAALLELDSLKKWLKDLGDEIEDRLDQDGLENNRSPRQMVVSFSLQLSDGRDTSSSRSYNFVADDDQCGEFFSNKSLELLMESAEGTKLKDDEPNRKLKAPIKFLGISVGKFEDNSDIKKTKKINDYFGAGSSKDVTVKDKDLKNENTSPPAENRKAAKKNNEKEFLLKKFFQQADKTRKEQNDTTKSHRDVANTDSVEKPVVESSLENQESFFAKYLNGALKTNTSNEPDETKRTITPVCDVVTCGDNSNDTEYSGSTINDEINKSIALFDEDPQEISRVSSIRELLNNSRLGNTDTTPTPDPEPVRNHLETKQRNQSPQPSISADVMESVHCAECDKTVPVSMFDTHADYHLALKIREEERQQVRQEIKEKNILKSNISKVTPTKYEDVRKKKSQPKTNSTETSMSNFLVKLDNSVITELCSICDQRVPVDKFAEHLDFHEAQRLSRELNKKEKTSYFTGNSAKRKRNLSSPVKKCKVPCKSIESFFR